MTLKYSQLTSFWTPAYAGVTTVFLKCHSRENGNPEKTGDPGQKKKIQAENYIESRYIN